MHNLSSLEREAREHAPEIRAEYRLVEISDDDLADFLLGFARTQTGEEVAYVYFKAGSCNTVAFDD